MSTKRERFVSPKGFAVWPHLHEPNTKFDEDGVYSVDLAFSPEDEDFKNLVKKLEKRRADAFKAWAKENPSKKKAATMAPVVREELDEVGEETGRLLLRFKMKASGVSKRTKKRFETSPDIFDAKGNKLKKAPAIGGGSVLKVAFEANGSYVASSKIFYLTLYLQAVQLIELVEFGRRDAEGYGFTPEKGYVADTKKSPFTTGSDEADFDEDDAETGSEDDVDTDEEGDDDGDY